MPSVMHTTSGMPASAASMIASAAPGGGTKIIEHVRRRCLHRVLGHVSKTGKPSSVVPPLPGVTPPTTLVP